MAVLAYLIGSVPTGLVLARLRRIDVRSTGSGNIGATNVARAAGPALGVATLLVDALKGALPVFAAAALAPEIHAGKAFAIALQCAAAAGAVLGHVFSIFLRLRGGKGVATALGAIAALDPLTLVLPLSVFSAAFWLTRRVSVGSILASATAPLSAILLGSPPLVTVSLILIGSVVILRHWENIRRLQAGSEPRFSA